MKISSILQYSTIDFRFLKPNLDQLTLVSDEIIVPICDHLFNGDDEDQDLLEKSIQLINSYPNATAYMFEWQGINPNPGYYHNLSRILGTQQAINDILFFVDADEIVDAPRFNLWVVNEYQPDATYWLTCYWYFREPIYQSTSLESAGLLIKKDKCNWNLNVRNERQQLFNINNFINGDHQHILYDGEPLIHHYSWVRTQTEMLQKVNNWGHKNDTNWVDLVKEEFNRPFNGTDFIHGYQYKIVENQFNL